MSEGMNIKNNNKQDHFCEACTLGKQHCTPSRQPMDRATTKFERIHTDIEGGGNTLTRDTVTDSGNRYYIVFTDDFTRYRWWYPLKTKSQAFTVLQDFLALIKNQFGLSLKKLRSDNGGEFASKAVQNYLREQGIEQELTVPHAPEQNGVAERANRTLIERARTQLIGAGLPAKLWAESLNTAVYLANRSPTRSLEKTPYEAWHGMKPDLSNLRAFGCLAYAYDYNAKAKGKMAPRSQKTRLLGYEGRNQYRLWDTETEALLRRRDIVFNEAVGALEAVGAIEDQEEEQDDEDGLPSIGTAGPLNPTTSTVPALAVTPPTPANPLSLPAASPAEKPGSESADNPADLHKFQIIKTGLPAT